MCGISCVIGLKEKLINKSDITKLHSVIAHRGPDSCNYSFLERVHLAHHRLAIIDLKRESDQPFNIDDEIFIIFNGEIYNHIEIRETLKKEGLKFRTESDTEVILNSYKFWGKECIKKFNGMWSFVIMDLNKNEIFCSRDRFGIKPFYYALNDNKIFIASELKQFNKFDFGRKANYQQIEIYLFSGLTNTSNQTFFKNIFCLNPGENLIVDLDNNSISKYTWYYPRIKNESKFDIQKIVNSVNLRLRSDVPIGCFLSGGVDSSLIASIANNICNGNIDYFHSRSLDKNNDEILFAKEIARSSSNNFFTNTPNYKDFEENIDDLVWTQDEPFGGLSVLMQFLLFKKVKENGIKVILDGQGADELMMGYSKYLIYSLFCKLKSFDFVNLIKQSQLISRNNFNMSFINQIKYFIATYNPIIRSYYNQFILHGKFEKIYEIEKVFKEYSNSFKEYKQIQIFETYNTSLQSLLRTEDRNSMRHSIESRLPYLDFLNFEHCLNLNINEKVHNGWTKYALRKSNLIPKSIAWRRDKIGFNSPTKIWINKYSSNMIKAVNKSYLIEKVLRKKFVIKNWSRLSYKQKWCLFNLSKWEEIFQIEI